VGFRGINNSFRPLLSAAWAMLPGQGERVMQSSDLKRLVAELVLWLDERGSLFDAPVQEELRAHLDRLGNAIEAADDAEKVRIKAELIQVTAALISVFTNVMSLFNK
jgi:hypothetical protein